MRTKKSNVMLFVVMAFFLILGFSIGRHQQSVKIQPKPIIEMTDSDIEPELEEQVIEDPIPDVETSESQETEPTVIEEPEIVVEQKYEVKNIGEGDDIESIINSNKITVVDFGADWCVPCLTVSDSLKEYAETYPNISFNYVDVDVRRDLQGKYLISQIPTIIIFVDGKELTKIVGNYSSLIKEQIEKASMLK